MHFGQLSNKCQGQLANGRIFFAKCKVQAMTGQSFREKFIAALAESGLSVAEVARRSGVGYDAINKLKTREGAKTSAENAAAIASVLGIDGASRQPKTLIDVYDVRASAGYGAMVEEEYIVDRLSFPPEFLARLTKTAPKYLSIIGTKGESMQPTLSDDDLVMIDMTKRNLDFDGLFVLRFGDALHVKRVGRAGKETVTIISDNPAYPAQVWQTQDVEVVGKVIWLGKKV